MSKITITIDGGSGVGKGAISSLVAKKLHYALIDSGAMYRTISYLLNEKNIAPKEVKLEHLKEAIFFYKNSTLYVSYKYKGKSEDFEVEKLPIRTQENSQNASKYAVIPILREYITEQIRNLMSQGGFVLEGRDAGSVIYPQAEIKFYIECPIEVRAKRRLQDYKKKGILYTQEEVEQELEERDFRDKNRETDPLVVPKNAYIIENDDSMNLEERVDLMIELIKK